MFVILVYDVAQQRVAKVLRLAREYLNWVQNSVLEGETTEGCLRELKQRLRRTIDPDEDSVVFYEFRSTKYSARDTLGVCKGTGSVRFL